MRISKQTLTAAGVTLPVPVNYLQPNFNVFLAVIPSAANTVLACGVQYTMDDQSPPFRPVNWTQTTTTVTITDGGYQPNPGLPPTPHGLITGDTVSIMGSGSGILAAGPAVGFDG